MARDPWPPSTVTPLESGPPSRGQDPEYRKQVHELPWRLQSPHGFPSPPGCKAEQAQSLLPSTLCVETVQTTDGSLVLKRGTRHG